LSESISIRMPKILAKYTVAANQACRKAAFMVYATCIKDYLSVVDGVSRRTKKLKPTPRTSWLGLRRPTGTLARNVKVGVHDKFKFTIINSVTTNEIKDRLLDASSVGIGDNVEYGAIQERGGRLGIKRLDGGYKFHPFLLPALNDSRAEVERMFDAEFKAAQAKNV